MKNRFMRLALSLAVLAVVGTPLAHAQATRTWVSGVGDDANPCSRTAPCKTFAGAISKTAPGGEINVLDPGGFGAVTITKPITISSESFEAGVLVSGTNGIVVSTPNANDVVVLRGLDIEGLGTGLSGIKVLTGGNVYVEKCTINHFSIGIDFESTVAGTQLHVTDTIVRNNGSGTTGGGVFIAPSGSGTVRANLDNVRMEGNVFGLKAQGNSTVSVADSTAAGNFFAGLSTNNAGGTTVLSIDHTVSSNNAITGGAGVVCAAGTTVRMNNMMIFNNTSAAVTTGGNCFTSHTNNIDVAGIAGLTFAAPQ